MKLDLKTQIKAWCKPNRHPAKRSFASDAALQKVATARSACCPSSNNLGFWRKSQQKTYVATLSALTAGTLIYTAWQFMVPTETDLPKSSIWIQVLLIISGIIISCIGYVIQEDGKK